VAVGLVFESREAASCVLCLTESPVYVESGNEISEDAMALACSVAVFGVPVHLSNSSSGMSIRTLSEVMIEVREITGNSIVSDAMVVDVTDISVTRISGGIKKVDEDRSHPKMT
jgi:hypothetical protein